MADYKIELGINLDTSDLQEQISLASKTVKPIKLDIAFGDINDDIREIRNQLNSIGKNGGLSLNTKSLEESLNKVSNMIEIIKHSLGDFKSKNGMTSIVTTVNHINTALQKTTKQFASLSKSLDVISRKDLSFNFNFKAGSPNPIKAMTEYGIEAKTVVIPALKEQVKYFEKLFGGAQKASNALKNYLRAQRGNYEAGDEVNRLSVIGDGYAFAEGDKSPSDSARMAALKQLIDLYKELTTVKKGSLAVDAFDNQYESADAIIKKTVQLQDGTKQASNQVDELGQKFKNVFGGGISAEGLSASLKPIVDDLRLIQEAVTTLSKDTSLGGLTASFNRLSESIENLLANAEKVKGVLNSGFDVNTVGGNIKTTKPSTTTRKRTTSEADEYLNGYLEYWNIKGEDAKTVKTKFKAFSDVSSLGAGNEAYDAALDDLTRTLRQLGKVYKAADDEAQQVLNVLKGRKIKATKDVYGAEFGDDWARIKRTYKMLRNEGIGVDSAYMDLRDPKNGVSSYFPDDIQNPASQLRQIIDVYDRVKKASKGGYVNLDDMYSRRGLGNEVLDIVNTMQEQIKVEQQITQASTESTNTIVQNKEKEQQEYKESLLARKQELEETIQLEKALSERFQDNISHPSPDDTPEDLQRYSNVIDESEDNIKRAQAELNQIDVTLKNIDAGGFKEIDIEIEEAENQIDSLRKALKSLGLNDSSVDNIISDFEKLGVTVKRVTSRINADDSMKLTVKGMNTAGDAVTSTATIAPDNEVVNWSNSVTREVNEVEQSLNRLKTITKEINGLKINAFKFNDKGNIEQAKSQMKALEKEASELRAELQKKFPTASLDEIDDIARRGQQALQQLRAEAAHKIKVDIAADKFENQVDQLRNGLSQLSDENGQLKNLRIAIEQVDNAYKRMQNASDDESLIQSQKEFAVAIAKANNELKIQTRLQNATNRKERLTESLASLEYDMLNWLQKNSKATKEYKGQIDALIDSLHRLDKADNLDEAHISGARRKFNNWDKDAELKGLKGLNFLDSIKSKIKEYSVYFGTAEMFMYAEQGLREMFNTVKEIDTAMTGLYRVTDLTSSQYNSLFNEMINSAKEYGATLNDIINATTDWVRAGFDADTALGLAEVTTMYQHISDLDYDTAAENLITAYNGFKDELNGAFSGDQVAAVEYIADIFNELDNNFAVTSAGLGEALTRSASALDLAGNTIQETAG